MSHGKSHTRFHRHLAKARRAFLKTFIEDRWEWKDPLMQKFKQRKQELAGT